MSKIFAFFLMAGAIFCVAAVVADDRPVTIERLPVQARLFLDNHFASVEVLYASIDRELLGSSYEVMLSNGLQIEFTRNGNWREIKSSHTPIPLTVVPRHIADYIRRNYPKAALRQVEIEHGEYEVRLSNGVEIIFGRDMRLVRSNDYTKPQPDHRFPLL